MAHKLTGDISGRDGNCRGGIWCGVFRSHVTTFKGQPCLKRPFPPIKRPSHEGDDRHLLPWCTRLHRRIIYITWLLWLAPYLLGMKMFYRNTFMICSIESSCIFNYRLAEILQTPDKHHLSWQSDIQALMFDRLWQCLWSGVIHEQQMMSIIINRCFQLSVVTSSLEGAEAPWMELILEAQDLVSKCLHTSGKD